MSEHYKKALEAAVRSKKDAALYLAACLVSGAIFALLCRSMGLDGYQVNVVMKEAPTRALAASLPGMVLTAWLGAGLVGRFTAHALGVPEKEFFHYANGWFLRKLAADLLLALVMWVPLVILAALPGSFGFFAVAWFGITVWLVLRVSLWLNASVEHDLSFPEAMRRSYAITKGLVPRIFMLSVVPMAAARSLIWLIGRALPRQAAAVYYSRNLFEGLAALVVMGALASLYASLPLRKGPTGA